ncbi:hypothetical protein J0S82_008191 [Galemys pyrenaicus]|uniref:Uncharacterized protein n=1 Tax=Galemys pyrenaicus TaxID=202257 RepID=A0A8J6DNX2_GALPY|nr:hypothetical protein J0S82_008191 [Galemys pyrenaicus]
MVTPSTSLAGGNPRSMDKPAAPLRSYPSGMSVCLQEVFCEEEGEDAQGELFTYSPPRTEPPSPECGIAAGAKTSPQRSHTSGDRVHASKSRLQDLNPVEEPPEGVFWLLDSPVASSASSQRLQMASPATHQAGQKPGQIAGSTQADTMGPEGTHASFLTPSVAEDQEENAQDPDGASGDSDLTTREQGLLDTDRGPAACAPAPEPPPPMQEESGPRQAPAGDTSSAAFTPDPLVDTALGGDAPGVHQCWELTPPMHRKAMQEQDPADFLEGSELRYLLKGELNTSHDPADFLEGSELRYLLRGESDMY